MIMEHITPNTIQSLADAASGLCGFRIHNMEDGVSLVVEWSHSLNMLDVDISSMYEEVCEHLLADDGGADVVISCDRTKLFIGFFVNLRNRTQYKTVDNMSTFYGMEYTALSGIVIHACVWKNMVEDGVRAMLHIDRHSTSCCFQFNEVQDTSHGFCLTLFRIMGQSWSGSLLLSMFICCGMIYLAWTSGRRNVCQYVFPYLYPGAQGLPFCRGQV